MKKVTAFVGSARKHGTYQSVRRFLASLQSLGDAEVEVIRLSDYRVETCTGCKSCFEKGEESCPYSGDDRDMLIEKMMKSDGVVFASPVYTFQVSALMKEFLDRLGFVCHRPRFFGKTFTNIVVQAFRGGPECVKYLDLVGSALGFNVVKGVWVPAGLEEVPEKEQRRTNSILDVHSRKFHRALMGPAYPSPTFLQIMAFRWSRSYIRGALDEANLDYLYYRDRGWFESAHYYPIRLNLVKRAAGGLFDSIVTRSSRRKSAASASKLK